MADMTKARKDHKCCLCHQPIAKGSEYVRQELTPWSGNDNEVFWTYKAHADCDRIFKTVAQDFEWQIPYDDGEWRDIVEAYEYEQKQKGA